MSQMSSGGTPYPVERIRVVQDEKGGSRCRRTGWHRPPERPERATQDEVRAACGCRPWDVSDVMYVLKKGALNLAGPGADRREMGVEWSEFVAADRSELVEEIVSELETRGVPSGAWLLDLAKVRQSLREADNLMRRLEDAIIRSSAAAPLDEL